MQVCSMYIPPIYVCNLNPKCKGTLLLLCDKVVGNLIKPHQTLL